MSQDAVIKIIGVAGDVTSQAMDAKVGQYVAEFYPEAFLGRGDIVTTDVLSEAKVYPSPRAAMEEWRTVPTTRRVRTDGRPNRPMTAFTVEIILKEFA